jgi:hypothetical protein
VVAKEGFDDRPETDVRRFSADGLNHPDAALYLDVESASLLDASLLLTQDIELAR